MKHAENKALELVEILHDGLKAVPGARFGATSWDTGLHGRPGPDAIMLITTGGGELSIVAETRGDAFPRDAREVAIRVVPASTSTSRRRKRQ